MSKIFKRLLGLAAVGGVAAAGVIYYLNKSESNDDDFLDEFDDEFDLDDDLNPAGEREYVSLNTAPKENAAEADTETRADAEAKEAGTDEAAGSKAEAAAEEADSEVSKTDKAE